MICRGAWASLNVISATEIEQDCRTRQVYIAVFPKKILVSPRARPSNVHAANLTVGDRPTATRTNTLTKSLHMPSRHQAPKCYVFKVRQPSTIAFMPKRQPRIQISINTDNNVFPRNNVLVNKRGSLQLFQ